MTDTTHHLLGGRYRLLEMIGTGGMGRVWRAHDQLLLRDVAVKEITVASTALLAAQTMREARAAARLDHPGVVQVFDVVWQHDRSWIVMEYVNSRSLHEVVRTDGPRAPREVARIGVQVLAALRAAHSAGVLHRDVKPHNVLLGPDGRVVLSDFGLATIGEQDGGVDPRLGSPHYIAPERLGPAVAGPPADLFSLGATLYAAVEGRAPFARGDVDASLRALLDDPPDPPRRAGPLSGIILGLLAKDPADRPHAAETESVLRAVVAGHNPPWRGRAAVPPPPSRRPPGRRYVVAGIAAALLATGGAGAYAAGAHRPPPQPSAILRPSGPSVAPSVAPADRCGFGVDAEPVVAATTGVPAGLPKGWIWFRDPTGFSLALPAGWQRSTTGNEVCFGDPAGRRAFTVNMIAVVTRQPLAYWQNREKAELAAGALPGYRRISMGVLLFKRGAADWEYTYRPDSDTTVHVRRLLAAVSGSRSYLLRWTAGDPDWTSGLGQQRQLMDLFASAP
ncbi:serine/threonine-protein kinase [Paractinoplanes toevensis]|uniref:non-specific serine/threonine protein kinase n=1 Tax=Paractinoplanes toevensis TaxID=571911 RepID=A0A919T758_9ACTN|nr:serine/threonine-protein kinase [Actinoplanes toevensis]GIM89667.1 serine/threonine protein kinase [Actinoplanes toevensis]